MRKYVQDIIGQAYKEWKKEDNILINCGTGQGKTYFVKNILKDYCKQNNLKILYLCNRTNLKKQVKNDIEQDNTITVLTYQKIERTVLERINLDNFDYIICDEAHYFFTDASFNRTTDLSFEWIVSNNACKILMTATAWSLKKYFKEYNISLNYTYELETDYSYIKKIICFKKSETIEGIIENIPQDEKILFFSGCKRALEISKKYKGAFICSQWNDKYKKYMDEEELKNITQNSSFNNHLLCTTTALDNGVNIIDKDVKHIILDVVDRDTFIQCLGRKRIIENEKITLYFADVSNKRINGFRTKIVNSLNEADSLIKHGDIKYTDFNYKRVTDKRIIDDIVIDGKIHKQVNKCMYAKFKNDLVLYSALSDKKLNSINKGRVFQSIIANQLKVKLHDIEELEIIKEMLSLEETLGSIVGKKLFKEEKKQLIEFIGLKDARGRLQKSIGQLNEYLIENKLNYVINEGKERSRKSENYNKRYWSIEKINN